MARMTGKIVTKIPELFSMEIKFDEHRINKEGFDEVIALNKKFIGSLLELYSNKDYAEPKDADDGL